MGVLVLIIIVIICWCIVKLYMKTANKKEAEAYLIKKEAESKAREQQEAQKLEDRRKQSENLYQKYLSSSLTQEIVNYLCSDNGTCSVPSKIQVRDDSVSSFFANGTIRKYDFIEHQVPKFDTVVGYEDIELQDQFLVKPYLEFAKAINTLLSDQYNIYDHGIRDLKFRSDDCPSSVFYTSDYIELTLKPINNF